MAVEIRGDYVTIMGIVAKRDGIELRGASVRVEKHMSADAPRRIVRLPVLFDMPARLGPSERKKLENAAYTCPVKRSLHPEVEVPIEFRYPD